MKFPFSIRRFFSPVMFVVFFAAFSAFARLGTPPVSLLQPAQPLNEIAQLVLPTVSIPTELAADKLAPPGSPFRFAVPWKVHVTPATHGTWEQLTNGRLWRMRFIAPSATDLNFGFTSFWMPPGATLHVYSDREDYFQGPYSARDNAPHGQLWTPVIPGDSAVIEMFVPSGTKEEPILVLSQIGLGYRDLFHRQKDLSIPKSGECEINVACPQADPWRKEIQSVARYSVNGSELCSGTLIMDANADFRSYFLTAHHCIVDSNDAPTVVVYWNYESPECGVSGGGSLAQNQSGATFRATKTDVDFTLIELDSLPDPSFHVYYSGWDNSGNVPNGAVGIHHPNGDEKAISFSTTPLTTTSSCITGSSALTHWLVHWSEGVTEPGSSGSGIWDPATHLLVGTLSGGSSSCDTPNQPDCYGKFSAAWNNGSTPASRLRDWLDPQNTGLTSMPGSFPPPIAAAGSSLVSETCLPANDAVDPGETVTMNFALSNFGFAATSNLVATLLATNGILFPSAPQTYGVLETNGEAVSRPFTFFADGICGENITASLQLRDGEYDLGNVSFVLTLGHFIANWSENFDAVAAPKLPGGWTTANSGNQAVWKTSATQSDSPPNAAFSSEAAAVGINSLSSPVIAAPAGPAQLSFRNRFDLEDGYDGGVLDIKIGANAFTDILAAGGSFASGGYNQVIATGYSNPLAGRRAWSGTSGRFLTTIVNLPAAASGKNIQFRWRCGTDKSVGGGSWYVDNVAVSAPVCCASPPLVFGPQMAGASFVFSFATLPGTGYAVEFKNALTDLNWQTLETLTGDGTIKTITNSASGAQRYFRVLTQ
ncbi:MAG TPA: trypsin-like peptidase domain-containing protein [Verrucomicrobiae bacterium]|nr:trypsin-like peptidase domain-containing protein [Verrucomicrobiae bacterium]